MALRRDGFKAHPILATLLVSGLLGACQEAQNLTPIAIPITDAGGGASVGGVGKAVLAPAGDYSLTTVRRRVDKPTDNDAREILCTAPSPDWATALAKAQQLTASGGASGGPSASLSASSSLTETISALAGRTAGVVALRDGLYKACEAYANGVIGKDTYALIVSQYGSLLVALAGSGGGAGGASGSMAPAQLSILDALLVSCISASDPSVPRGDERSGNPLFWDARTGQATQVCTDLIKTVADSARTLLAPASAGTPGGATAGSSAGPWTVPFTARATFADGARATVTMAGGAILGAIAKAPNTKVTVTGSTDPGGTAAENSGVALARANAVLQLLAADGVPAANLAAPVDGSALAPKTRTATIVLAVPAK